jgi:hypothetical protein
VVVTSTAIIFESAENVEEFLAITPPMGLIAAGFGNQPLSA